VRFTIDACVPVDGAETARLAAMELRADAVDTTDAATSVSVRCDGDRAILRVEDAATRKSVERAVRLADLRQRGAARLLALAVSELVFASWAELYEPSLPMEPADPPLPAQSMDAVRTSLDQHESPSAAPARSPPPSVSSPAPIAASTPFLRPRFALVAFERTFPAAAGNAAWLGARIESGITLGPYGLVSLGLGFAGASSRGDVGRIDGWIPEASLLGGIRYAARRIEFRSLVGVHAGVALFQGVAATPILTSAHLVAGAWFGPSLEIALAWHPVSRAALFATVDAGYSAVGITARTQIIDNTGPITTGRFATPELGATGPWVTVGLGVSYEP
jgi:hypothetical protein